MKNSYKTKFDYSNVCQQDAERIVVCLTFNREMRRGNSGGGRISQMRDLETLSDRMEGSGEQGGGGVKGGEREGKEDW